MRLPQQKRLSGTTLPKEMCIFQCPAATTSVCPNSATISSTFTCNAGFINDYYRCTANNAANLKSKFISE